MFPCFHAVQEQDLTDNLGVSGGIWIYAGDIVVQGDWKDKDDDFTFRSSEVVNGGSDMVHRAWVCVCDMTARVRCPGDLLWVYAFRCVRIVVYDVGEYYMCVLSDSGELDSVCGCVVVFAMFLVYFQDNECDIITTKTISGITVYLYM